MSPIKAGTGPFVIALATDSKEAPRIDMVEKGIDLVAADQFAPTDKVHLDPFGVSSIAMLVFGIVFTGYSFWQWIKLR
jgi:hypothetical protein